MPKGVSPSAGGGSGVVPTLNTRVTAGTTTGTKSGISNLWSLGDTSSSFNVPQTGGKAITGIPGLNTALMQTLGYK